jgi:hypothetical protein
MMNDMPNLRYLKQGLQDVADFISIEIIHDFSVLTKGAIFSKTRSGIKQLVGYTRRDQNAEMQKGHTCVCRVDT